jgi:CubicO group peptidase (beta-lactamase class C family)
MTRAWILFLPVLSACASSGALTLDRGRSIEALFAGYSGTQVPGASVIVIEDGRVTFRHAYGMADLEHHRPATAATAYRLASLTKQFTAMAVILLVRDGRLRYDQPVRELLPELPPAAAGMTIRHLLNHTSGLVDYEDLIPDTQTVQVSDLDVLHLLSARDSVYFPPGTRYRYSNSGYCLLALVVERVSGMPFARFLRERLFTPLGMTRTVAHREGQDTVPERAYGYTPDSGRFVPSDQSVTSATLGDGGIYTSVEELVHWDEALYTERLVDRATLALATTPPALPDDSTQYGFGWFVDTYRGLRRWRHTGETSGFTNAIQRFPERRTTIIILTNRNGGAPWTIAERIADLLLF